ncbi:LexA family protein [Paenibacillus spongiae]|uniref:LexA family protein n=1 Tax=Paenibacillus spongiae TaxID=2909671 RepID=UPI00283A925D|nr:S24 family peptidase [Paenibacillus spongiae]
MEVHLKLRSFGEVLRELREKRGLAVNQLALYSGVSPALISKLENGHRGNPKPETIEKLSKGLKMEYAELMRLAGYIDHGVESKKKSDNLIPYDASNLVQIPIYGEIKAGYNSLAKQDIIGYEYVSQSDVQDGEYFYLIVKGDSMIEDGIIEGSRVLVRKQGFIENGKIGVVLCDDEEATLKRVFYDGDNIILVAANKLVRPKTYRLDEIQIQGQVKSYTVDV